MDKNFGWLVGGIVESVFMAGCIAGAILGNWILGTTCVIGMFVWLLVWVLIMESDVN